MGQLNIDALIAELVEHGRDVSERDIRWQDAKGVRKGDDNLIEPTDAERLEAMLAEDV